MSDASLRPLSIAEVGSLMGVKLPEPGGRAVCPLRKHKRHDKTFRVSKGVEGDPVWRCFACDSPEDKGDLDVSTMVKPGSIEEAILETIREQKANALVLGTHGRSAGMD